MFLPEGKYNKSVITQEMVQHGLVALGLMFHSGYALVTTSSPCVT